MGLSLDRMPWSRSGFFGKGVTSAVLKIDGTSPVSRDLLIRVVTNISRRVGQVLIRDRIKGVSGGLNF